MSLLWAGYWGPVEEPVADTDLEWASLQQRPVAEATRVSPDVERVRDARR